MIPIHPTAKVAEDTDRKLSARNMAVQLLALYIEPKQHNAQCYRWTGRETAYIMIPIDDRTV